MMIKCNFMKLNAKKWMRIKILIFNGYYLKTKIFYKLKMKIKFINFLEI